MGKLDRLFGRLARWGRLPAYRLHDAREELATFRQSHSNQFDVVHFLDAEHGVNFLPGLLAGWGKQRQRPLLVGMYHQPVQMLEAIIKLAERLPPRLRDGRFAPPGRVFCQFHVA